MERGPGVIPIVWNGEKLDAASWVGHIGGCSLHVPKGFVQRALILGFLP